MQFSFSSPRRAGKVLSTSFVLAVFCWLLCLSQEASAQISNLAPDFTTLPKGAKVVIMPTDIELFSLSAGGVLEPKADWTEAAARYFKAGLIEKKKEIGVGTVELSDANADELSAINALHGAVARAIAIHHFGPLRLPTKDGKLDWSMGEAVTPIRQKSGADYALFTWVRDSYTSGERVVAMIALAAVGIGIHGGAQTGYASLVDLNTGKVVWFNRLFRVSGDLRDAEKAKETVNALLSKFPTAQ